MAQFTSEYVGGPEDGKKSFDCVPPQDRDERTVKGHVYRFNFGHWRGLRWEYVGPVRNSGGTVDSNR